MSPFHTVLFAADLSSRSKAAFDVACSIAHAGQGRVSLAYVLEPAYIDEPFGIAEEAGVSSLLPAESPEQRQALLDRLRDEYVPDVPVEVDFILLAGDPAEEIINRAEAVGADLIVMGTQGRRGLDRLLTGSVAEAVLRHAPVPVLAVRSPAAAHAAGAVGVVLHPTDFSDRSQASLQVARSMAVELGARLVLLHVEPTDLPYGGTFYVPADVSAERALLESLRHDADGPDLKHPVEARLVRGEPTAEILKVAKEIGADLIVMGTHGRTGLLRLALGSVAEHVLRGAPCPVLALKQPVASHAQVAR